ASYEPANVEAWQALCQHYFEHGDVSKAKGALLELLRRNSQDASTYHNLGTVYMRLGQPLEAIEAYRNSLRYRPDSSKTFLHLGNALRTAGRFEEAIDTWDRALQLDPENLEAAEALRQGNDIR